MRKRVILQVNKIVSKNNKKQSVTNHKVQPNKHLNFQQLFTLIKKSQNINNNSHLVRDTHQSANTSFTCNQSLKASRSTPQHTTRSKNIISKKERLNHSLQDKSQSLQKQKIKKRSLSNQKFKTKNKNQKVTNSKQKDKLLNTKKQIIQNDDKYANSQQQEGRKQFTLDFSKLVTELNHNKHQHLRETECFLSLQQIFNILKKLHYLRKVQDQKYLLKIWQQLQGQTYGGVPSHNLFQFLTYINFCDARSNFSSKQTNFQHKKIIINSNLKIVATEQSKLQIYQQYLTLRVNRILYGISPQQIKQSIVIHHKSNIKIQEEDQEEQNLNQNYKQKDNKQDKRDKSDARYDFSRKNKNKQIQNVKRTVRLKSNKETKSLTRTTDTHSYLMKQKTQSPINTDNSQSKQTAGTVLTSQSSQNLEEIYNDRRAVLSVDVNLGDGLSEKLTVYEGQTAFQVSKRLVQKYKIDEQTRTKFEVMLNSHMKNLLWRIQQVSEQLISDRQ